MPAPAHNSSIATLARCNLPIKTANPHFSCSTQKFCGRDPINSNRNNLDQQLESILSKSRNTEAKGCLASQIAQLIISAGYYNHYNCIKQNQTTQLRSTPHHHPRIFAKLLTPFPQHSQTSPSATQERTPTVIWYDHDSTSRHYSLRVVNSSFRKRGF